MTGEPHSARFSSEQTGRRLAITSLWLALVAAGILFLAARIANFPVPKWPPISRPL
jgi:hypothetical protein